jgi:hypothetical protein
VAPISWDRCGGGQQQLIAHPRVAGALVGRHPGRPLGPGVRPGGPTRRTTPSTRGRGRCTGRCSPVGSRGQRAARTRRARVGSGEIEQMCAFGLVELQCPAGPGEFAAFTGRRPSKTRWRGPCSAQNSRGNGCIRSSARRVILPQHAFAVQRWRSPAVSHRDWWRGVTVSAHAVLGRRSGGHVRERSNLHRA